MKRSDHTKLRMLIREAMQADTSPLRDAVGRLETLKPFDLWNALDVLNTIPDDELGIMFGQPEIQRLASLLEKLAVMLSEIEYIIADAGVIEPATY